MFVLLTLSTILLSWATMGRGQNPPSSQAPQAGQPSGPTPEPNPATTAGAQGTAVDKPVPIAVNDVIRIESDLYFEKYVTEHNVGKFVHVRQPASIEMQGLAQMDPGTIYSTAVFDLEASPVTITLPDSGDRVMSMQVVSEDHFTPGVVYAPGRYTYTKENVGTRYAFMIVGTLANPQDPSDVKGANGLQDAIQVEQMGIGKATSREEEIRHERTDKRARLWPERTASIVKLVDKYTASGLIEGAQSLQGKNGAQLVLGGMRSGNGTTFGVGYRRIDLWGEKIGFRATARGTAQQAYMFDLGVDFPQLATRRGELGVYAKYENSPQMDYYGPGQDSRKEDRTSYRLEDTSIDLKGRYRVWKGLWLGFTGGLYAPNTGPGQREGYPSTEEKFTPAQTPGIDNQANFLRAGFTVQYDYRDLPTGPRSGGNYYLNFRRYWDQSLGQHTFNNWDTAVEQYFPYWNKTRVVALRLAMVATQAREGQTVPFYLQPTLGGNEFLRGFERYRFYDQCSLIATIEHRWHLFSNGHAAVFVEAGKVAPAATVLNLARANYAGGIGFRFTLRNAVVMRIDNGISSEGYRFIWTFSNMW